jgi:hypothetical protein
MIRWVPLAALLCAAPLAAQDTGAAVQTMQQQIMADPKLAAQVESLRDNPQVRSILADPDIAEAIKRGDMSALMSNPKIQQLAEDPEVQELTRGLGQDDAESK